MGQTQEASKQEASRSSCASVYSRLVTAVAYVIWLVAFLTWGGVTLHENAAISDNQACGKTTHMLKYITLNIVFISGVFLSYLLFPGAGEGARARATLLLAVHGALAVWGMLLWTSVEGTCRSKLSSIFPAIVLFEHVCIAHNSVFFLMFLLHESLLGTRLGYDYTLLPEKSLPEAKDFMEINEDIAVPSADTLTEIITDGERGIPDDGSLPMWMEESAVPTPTIHGTAQFPTNHSEPASHTNHLAPECESPECDGRVLDLSIQDTMGDFSV